MVYATIKEIAGKWFDGETIPTSNTITQKRLDFIISLAQRKTNNAINVTVDQIDVNGILKDTFLEFFGKELKGLKLILYKETEEELLKQYQGIAFHGILP